MPAIDRSSINNQRDLLQQDAHHSPSNTIPPTQPLYIGAMAGKPYVKPLHIGAIAPGNRKSAFFRHLHHPVKALNS